MTVSILLPCYNVESMGTITYKEHEEFISVYGDPCDQPARKFVKDNPEFFKDTVDCYSSDYLEDNAGKKYKDLKNIIKSINTNDIYWSQIEGSYYKSEIFDSICDVIDKHFDYKTIDKDDLYAREEVYFPTVFWGLYKGSDTIKVDKKGMFTFVPWQRVGISVNIGEAIWHSKNESDIFCIKRVARKLEDSVRSYIRQKYNYSDFFGLSNLVCRYPLLYIQIRDMYRRIQLKYIDRIKTKLKK